MDEPESKKSRRNGDEEPVELRNNYTADIKQVIETFLQDVSSHYELQGGKQLPEMISDEAQRGKMVNNLAAGINELYIDAKTEDEILRQITMIVFDVSRKVPYDVFQILDYGLGRGLFRLIEDKVLELNRSRAMRDVGRLVDVEFKIDKPYMSHSADLDAFYIMGCDTISTPPIKVRHWGSFS